MQIKTLKTLFNSSKEDSLFGRYIHYDSIAPLLEKLNEKFQIEDVGKSVNGIPIRSVTFGFGDKKILMWSQMHGNESTTTKAIFDLFNAVANTNESIDCILEHCTIKVIPILNPDGAKAYTRLNANAIDLNRDAQELSQPESKVLRAVFDSFKPDFCFNLHGQRTIFSAGHTPNSATVSFLAPAQDAKRSLTTTRKIAMEIIIAMNKNLQRQIQNRVGVYDDSFNLNCVGDTFQSEGVPTVLFEAGHAANDYMREETRALIFQSLVIALDCIALNTLTGVNYESYFDIPENQKKFYDIIIRNTNGLDVAVQFQEVLKENSINFVPKIEKISDLKNFYAHKEIDAKGYQVFGKNNTTISEANEIDFVMINNEKFLLKP
ncbi:M14 family zinc carboxypeptidase [uncultured Psychroserpens sp.]|uniref:M14 family zinc carboxypeptidase n=1 Tax=uncultured Psychroserpens sp. TaxID=255436 RepID=UPI002636EF8B|nr:M14 family zinc carboxypeptidase [uncultured Psychroserpens sp.]